MRTTEILFDERYPLQKLGIRQSRLRLIRVEVEQFPGQSHKEDRLKSDGANHTSNATRSICYGAGGG